MLIVWSTYKRIRTGILRAVPWSFMVSRVATGVTQILFPYFLYRYFMKGNLSPAFLRYTGGADYITYIVLGSALNVLAVSTLMNVGRALITELREGTLEVLLLAPASRGPYFAGCLWEQTARALLEFGATLLVGALLGARLGPLFSLSALAAIGLAILSFFCMGLLLSGVMLRTRDTYITQNTLFVTMSLVCGVVFPIQYLPEWVQRLAQVFPLTPAVELFRSAVLRQEPLSAHPGWILQILLLSGLYLLAGVLWNRRLEKTMLENIFG